jgi:predicted secreted hydrolase
MRENKGNRALKQASNNKKNIKKSSIINDDWEQYPYKVGKLRFPEDEGKHDKEPREWWYINLHLVNETTYDKYDVMLSYFPEQIKLIPSFRVLVITDEQEKHYLPPKKQYMGSLTISNKKQDIRFKKFFNRDRWYELERDYAFQYSVKVDAGKYGLNLRVRSTKPPLPVNGDGYIGEIGDGGYTYYYSLTNLNVVGILKINRKRIPVIGKGWIDHQYGAFFSSEKEETFEWFSIQLNNNVEIICGLVYVDGKLKDRYMTYMLQDNQVVVPDDDEFNIEILDYWTDPRLQKYSSKWRITEQGKNLDITVTPVIPNQLSHFPYPLKVDVGLKWLIGGLYEGSTIINGKFDGKSVKGVGFAELTHTHT